MLGPYAAILRRPGAVRLVAASLGARLSFGLFDLALILLAERESGSFGLAGLAVGVHAAGIGLTAPLRGRLLDRVGIYGSRAWRTEPIPRLVVVLAAFSAVLLTLGRVDSIAIFAVLLLLAGAPSAAQWATSSVALDDVTPDGQHAEAYTWLSSANAAGIALGGVLAGALIDAHGTPAAFLAAGALAAAAALVVFLRRPNAPALAAAHSDGPTPAAPPSVP